MWGTMITTPGSWSWGSPSTCVAALDVTTTLIDDAFFVGGGREERRGGRGKKSNFIYLVG